MDKMPVSEFKETKAARNRLIEENLEKNSFLSFLETFSIESLRKNMYMVLAFFALKNLKNYFC